MYQNVSNTIVFLFSLQFQWEKLPLQGNDDVQTLNWYACPEYCAFCVVVSTIARATDLCYFGRGYALQTNNFLLKSFLWQNDRWSKNVYPIGLISARAATVDWLIFSQQG